MLQEMQIRRTTKSLRVSPALHVETQERERMDYNFGTLKNVELRKAWPHEALNFTQWVSTQE